MAADVGRFLRALLFLTGAALLEVTVFLASVTLVVATAVLARPGARGHVGLAGSGPAHAVGDAEPGVRRRDLVVAGLSRRLRQRQERAELPDRRDRRDDAGAEGAGGGRPPRPAVPGEPAAAPPYLRARRPGGRHPWHRPPDGRPSARAGSCGPPPRRMT
ncbi:hypothetical protein [Allostreptomyces psammosilenae]|uniref:Uncharacterized protein n=1 Tax=Allostreptomyces psammosilenae TaxID=1892865 RepID=A0A852ZMI5_9ACTN|nr:hypothetical protein [Allostreptomyces psammosilenae]NYI03623.1 hypothetical protein [Allostreptomyces psammosilenae]